MVAVVIVLVVIVTLAAGILAMVAAPRLRQGEELLTPEGRQSIVRAGQRTREQSASAAGNTVQAVSSLGGRMSSLWAPVSAFLHHQFDRLESRPNRSDPTADASDDENPYSDMHLDGGQDDGRHGDGNEAGRGVDGQFGQPASGQRTSGPAGGASVGRPRPTPAESGPIPVDLPSGERGAGTRPHPRIR